MNKDKEIALIECDSDNLKIQDTLCKDTFNKLKRLVGYNIHNWLSQRTGFVGRKNIEILQKYLRINNRESLLNIEKVLVLMIQYGLIE